jgi:preprotein translocase subunit YajC
MPEKNILVKRRIFYCTMCDWVYVEDKKNERMTKMLNVGDKVTVFGQVGEVTRIFKNGRVEVAQWVQTMGMLQPQLWKSSYSAKSVARA